MTKYRAQRTECDGIVFASKREAKRYRDLCLLEHSGEIAGLELQPRYDIMINSHKVCRYIADFRYKDASGRTVVEDCKGMRTPLYRLKAKLMYAVYGITITET